MQVAKERDVAASILRDLKRAGLKMTPQRLAIVHLFADDSSHPTAQELFERLREDYPTMSFATVYNTLDALANAGLCDVLRFGAGTDGDGRQGSATRFDPNTAPHHHAVCERCGAVSDLEAGTRTPTASAVRNLKRKAPGFTVLAVERIYRGLCSACVKSSPTSSGMPARGSHRTKTRS